MEIVEYDLEDAKDVASFFREIFEELGWKERSLDHMDEPHLLFHLPDRGTLLLVKENGNLIGTAGLILLNEEDALVKRFYIKKSYRGSGIAKNLLDELILKAKSMGVKRLVLDASKNNTRAVHFWKKNRFLLTSVEAHEDWPESSSPETHYYFYKTI